MNYKPSIPAYIQIKEDIINKIRTGVWEKNTKIPSELNLMEIYSVGRGTIRESIKQIVDEGYVYIKKGVGTFVSQDEIGVTFEPFVSLTYFIKMRGLQITTKILEQKEFIVDEDYSAKTGLEVGSKTLFVKRLRILEGKPLAIEEFSFSEASLDTFEGFDFQEPISHYMFDLKKIAVNKMEMDFNVTELSEEVGQILELKPKTRMIKSSRRVFTEPNNDIFYYLEFYCGEKLQHLGTEKFI